MIAAIYARKSTEQTDVNGKEDGGWVLKHGGGIGGAKQAYSVNL